MAEGIRDKVAVIGMGCSKFGERWDMSAADLMVEAFNEGIGDAGIDQAEVLIVPLCPMSRDARGEKLKAFEVEFFCTFQY